MVRTKQPHMEAFDKLPHEVSIPLDKSGYNFQFTRRWFQQRNQSTWSTFLKPKFEGRPIRMLQIGVFEGYDLAWCFQNILTHHASTAWAIDPWLATGKLDQEYMDGVERRARHNLSPWRNKLVIFKGMSQSVTPTLRSGTLDLIVIDGDHNDIPVLEDAVEALRLLRPGGWMVFDDVRNRIPKANHVYDGIQMFLKLHSERVRLAWRHRYCDCYEKV